jgi:hypothetical protein
MVSVHGWIEGDDEARELLRVVRDTRAPVVLDLEEGARLSGASDFITLLLESNDHSAPVPGGETNGGAP